MNEKVFITGAAGFVGNHLVPFLQKKGYKITSLVRTKKEKDIIQNSAKVVIGDLSEKGSWQDKIQSHDFIIHLAAIVSSRNRNDFEKHNVTATQNLIEAAKKFKIKKIILFSSAAVTSIRKDPYATSKEKQEELVKKSKIKYSILRPSMIYGPGDTKNVGWLIKFIRKSPIIPLPAGGTFGRQPVYVEDICKIVQKLLEKDYSKSIYEIHGFEYVSLKRMIQAILKALKAKKVIFNIPISFLTLTFAIGEKILPNPKFTVDQIKSLTSGEKFSGEPWWKTFDIIPTKFEAGVARMIRKK